MQAAAVLPGELLVCLLIIRPEPYVTMFKPDASSDLSEGENHSLELAQGDVPAASCSHALPLFGHGRGRAAHQIKEGTDEFHMGLNGIICEQLHAGHIWWLLYTPSCGKSVSSRKGDAFPRYFRELSWGQNVRIMSTCYVCHDL